MTEPQIRYARTRDGLDIACYAHGTGPAVVWVQFPFSHLQAELRDPDTARTYAAVARLATLVRYDPRGFGLSTRSAESFTLEELGSDLEAVVERLQLDGFLLLAGGGASPMALRYVATNPGRVTHLVLFPGYARIDGIAWKQSEALAAMATDDWHYVSEAMIRATFGWGSEEASRRDAELLREAMTPQTFVKYMAHVREWDASAYVADVTVPTLLLQQPEARYTTMEAARRLVSELRDGRLVMIEGATPTDRRSQTIAAVAELVGRRLPPQVDVKSSGTGTAVILFTDIVDSTALTERLGDEAFRAASRALDASIRSAIRDTSGTPVEGKVLGDGVMGVFASAAHALRAAIACVDLSERSELRLHVGLHAGDVIHEEGNVYGGTVNIASRICALSASRRDPGVGRSTGHGAIVGWCRRSRIAASRR